MSQPSLSMFQKSSPGTPAQKKKKKRFSDKEDHVLVDEIMNHASELFGKNARIALGKCTIWDSVAKVVNEVSETNRTVQDCKKRWNDYKRKIKRTIDEVKKFPETGNTEPLENFLSKRQMRVVDYFQMDLEEKNTIQHLSDHSSVEEEDSDEDFVDDSKKGMAFFLNQRKEHNPQDTSISQSSKQTSEYKTPDAHGEEPAPTPVVPPMELAKLDVKLDQLMSKQTETYEFLQSMQNDIRASQEMQRKMNRLMKTNFLELQKSIISIQNIARDRENQLDLSLKSIHTKLDEMTNTLREKKLRDLMASDDSDEEWNSVQDVKVSLLDKQEKVQLKQKRKAPQTTTFSPVAKKLNK
ncbi:putative leucine-rich repeat-containing protein DDB_G0290503 isoform X2 [Xenopus laevis]|uniref:Leucine-rich repeat-containing protein DDB_G0290503 isoform X2 n=1 Tax=Xenopus laevis TaxID=8355 RepID=A0A8J1L8D7_XENLA|nr:putative leucine-rich repeat-containing protein DDB_G0290503 isoform X2 [Xenopus laevis]